MQDKCNGKNQCKVLATNGLFGDPCRGVVKYLTATWECSHGQFYLLCVKTQAKCKRTTTFCTIQTVSASLRVYSATLDNVHNNHLLHLYDATKNVVTHLFTLSNVWSLIHGCETNYHSTILSLEFINHKFTIFTISKFFSVYNIQLGKCTFA